MPAESEAAQLGEQPEDVIRFSKGEFSFNVDRRAVRNVRFAGVEVLRMVDCPVRDADWRTIEVEELAGEPGPGLRYRRLFRTADGAFRGSFEAEARVEGHEARLEVRLELTAERDAVVNRAGLVLLHPILGVAGKPVEVVHPDGSIEAASFPRMIAPSQPVFDIAGLRHRVGPVAVEIAMDGEVFEMEDQRNWTDASFKTYCRPLSRPRPFTVPAGQAIRQRVVVTLRAESAGSAVAAKVAAARAEMPAITLAHEAALCGPVPDAVARLEVEGVLERVEPSAPEVKVGAVRAPVTLEIVTGKAPEEDFARVRDACAAAGMLPARVVALPRGYLASHQPEGPWPDGPRPMDLVPMVRAAFPDAEVGVGMLTSFTEFNRCRPVVEGAGFDFATFGTSAIVHAADDRSVLETLEAFGDIFATAREIVGAVPLRLGLISIGMRSNPYGASVAENPHGLRIPMAMADPRQRESFGAAWAVGVAAAAARGGVASYAPAMTGGPLGVGTDGMLWPIYHVVAALAALGSEPVEVAGGPAGGLVAILGKGRRGVRGIVANLGRGTELYAAPDGTAARVLDLGSQGEAARDTGWIEGPGVHETVLAPMAVAVLREVA